jgi:hypothetical protein
MFTGTKKEVSAPVSTKKKGKSGKVSKKSSPKGVIYLITAFMSL